MEKLPKYTHENGIDYVLVGDYYIPMLTLPEENSPIGRWGRMHQKYLKENRPGYYSVSQQIKFSYYRRFAAN